MNAKNECEHLTSLTEMGKLNCSKKQDHNSLISNIGPLHVKVVLR